MRRRRRNGRSAFLCRWPFAALLLGACAGTIDDPIPFWEAASQGSCMPGFEVESDLLLPRCGTLGCHIGSAGIAAGGLDLVSSGVGDRLLSHISMDCNQLPLIDRGDIGASYFLTKVTVAPPCGDPMPLGELPLTLDEVSCLRRYIEGLVAGSGAGSGTGSRTVGP